VIHVTDARCTLPEGPYHTLPTQLAMATVDKQSKNSYKRAQECSDSMRRRAETDDISKLKEQVKENNARTKTSIVSQKKKYGAPLVPSSECHAHTYGMVASSIETDLGV
jgi:regulatory protein YycH of two-component signal transduction system YycFG